MYQICYLIRVPVVHTQRFVDIYAQAAAIYLHYGAISSTVSQIVDGEAHYGCRGLFEQSPPERDEQVFFGLDVFPSREKYLEGMRQLDADSRVDSLADALMEIVDLQKAIRWESDLGASGYTAAALKP